MKNMVMKKVVSSLCALAIVLLVAFGGTALAHAGSYEEESDLVFRKAMEEILSDEEVTAETIKVIKAPVYDLALNQLGFIYTMQYDLKEGYALVINTDGMFEVSEFYMEADNPFSVYYGQNVYVNLLFYLVYQNDTFIEVSSGTIVDNETLTLLGEKAFYSGDNGFSSSQEVIYYTNRTEDTYELTRRHPAYFPVGLSNACVAAAAGNIIGFYDRYYENLIPDFTPGSIIFNYYFYKEFGESADAAIATLSNYMGTNVSAPGTSIQGFKNGMSRYVNEKGLGISYNSCMQNGNLNFSTTKQNLESGMPLILFLDTYTIASLSNPTDHESVVYYIGSGCHAMAGFGYKEIYYNLTNGQTRNDRYIMVATGLTETVKGYFNVNYKTQVDECYAINIY